MTGPGWPLGQILPILVFAQKCSRLSASRLLIQGGPHLGGTYLRLLATDLCDPWLRRSATICSPCDSDLSFRAGNRIVTLPP
jgi:hypothetical protein